MTRRDASEIARRLRSWATRTLREIIAGLPQAIIYVGALWVCVFLIWQHDARIQAIRCEKAAQREADDIPVEKADAYLVWVEQRTLISAQRSAQLRKALDADVAAHKQRAKQAVGLAQGWGCPNDAPKR